MTRKWNEADGTASFYYRSFWLVALDQAEPILERLAFRGGFRSHTTDVMLIVAALTIRDRDGLVDSLA